MHARRGDALPRHAVTSSAAVVVFNADVRVVDAGGSVADAVAWRDGRIVAVGAHEEVARVAGAGATTWNAAGATVLPGFVDAHHHAGIAALYGGVVPLVPPGVTDVRSLQRTLASAAAALPPGAWLVATAWDEARLVEHRPPTRAELDDAVPDHPLFAMHYSCHRGLANSRALALAGIGRGTAEPSGGEISRDHNGLPDGLLIERGMSRVETLARAFRIAHDAEGFLARLAEHYRALVAVGITRLAEATVPGDLATLYREAARRGLVTVPTVLMPVSTQGYLEAPWDVLDAGRSTESPASAGGGPLIAGPVKLVFDGAPGCAMCLGWWQVAGVSLRALAMTLARRSLDPARAVLSVAPRLGRDIRTGIRIYARDEAHEIVRTAGERGFSVATHAIGNDAIDLALSAYEAAGKALHASGVPRIEHATFLDRELVARIAGVGAAVVAQPNFMSLAAFGNAPPIPRVRNSPLRWLLDAGVKVAGSSDFPVAGFDPLDGIRAAVSRRTARARVYEADQCIGLDEAVAMYTRVAAEVCGGLAECGTLEVGKRADLVVLDARLSLETLPDARVRGTVVGGDVLFGTLGA